MTDRPLLCEQYTWPACPETPAINLTPRELDILRLVSRGMTNRKIARSLDISEKTVKNHLSAIYSKIGAADRTQAALYALEGDEEVGQEPIHPGHLATDRPGAHDDIPPEAAALTSRETDVLRLISRGMTNRKIARSLDISEKTVKNHLSAIYSKIGAADRTQAALYAVRCGLRSPARALEPRLASAG